MNDTDENFEGKVIPETYWNTLVEWRVSMPYDGCWWHMSLGCVDGTGDFHTFNATGRDMNDWMEVVKTEHGLAPGYKGLYDHSPGWKQRETSRIKHKHGFDGVEDPSTVVSRIKYDAIEKEFGKKWYSVKDEDVKAHPDVIAALEEPTKRLKAYQADIQDLIRRRQERMNAMFMGALLDKTPEEWALYPIGEDDIKETCRKFCQSYRNDVGMMCGTLDKLLDLGYSPWCTCSDCGKQFQLREYEYFSHLIDDNDYTGDNGIGIILKRVQCEDCYNDTECQQCQQPNLPNPNQEGALEHAYDHCAFEEAFIAQWLGVCIYCAEKFFGVAAYKHWSDDVSEVEDTIDDDKLELKRYLEHMKASGTDESTLARLERENLDDRHKKWNALINELRDKMEDDVKEHFTQANEHAEERLTEKDTNYVY